jgi:hypothetical protein
MKYALLIYTTPGASERPAAEQTETWLDYIRAIRESGVLPDDRALTGGGAGGRALRLAGR